MALKNIVNENKSVETTEVLIAHETFVSSHYTYPGTFISICDDQMCK